MDSRQRFVATMGYGKPDRPPLFEEGIRDGVLEAWRAQGFSQDGLLQDLFDYDRREEIDLETRPGLDLVKLAGQRNGLKKLRQRLERSAEGRMPEDWRARLAGWRERRHVLMLLVHWGFLQAIGIEDWRSFARSLYLLADEPDFVRQAMLIQGELAAGMADRLLKEVHIDAALFSEPIGGNHGALVSPRTYRQFALYSYRPILEVLKRHGVQIIIWRTYANARVLLPAAVEAGINCLWAVESNPQAMDYRSIREEFGRDLRLIGGIDLDMLRQGREHIRETMERSLPPLLAQGGYIPLADGRVRPEISFENYCYYRQLLERLVGGV
ncbi:MAG: uroporphyrinogen decarboxylase family protein [Chloroflexota bacterium]